jgi:hypothetical protein
MADKLICTPCGHEIPEEAKYLAVFRSERGLRLEVGCVHQPVAGIESAEAVFGSAGCLAYWIGQLLTPCAHPAGPVF